MKTIYVLCGLNQFTQRVHIDAVFEDKDIAVAAGERMKSKGKYYPIITEKELV